MEDMTHVCIRDSHVCCQSQLFYFCFGFDSFKSSPASSRFIGNIAVSAKTVRGQRFNAKQKIGEDQDFILYSLLKTHAGVAFADIAYRYRLRKSSLSHNPKLRFDDLDRFIQWMEKDFFMTMHCSADRK